MIQTQISTANKNPNWSWSFKLPDTNSVSCLVWRQAKMLKLKCLEVTMAQNDREYRNI